ncbi:MAG: hypothetical protein ACTS77_01985 [Arsenophonus sp. NC-TX2-MAG3]
MKKIISRGELRVSTINSPIMSFNDKQEASGFDYELTKGFARLPWRKTTYQRIFKY